MEVEEAAAPAKPSGDMQQEFSPELLKLYYDRIFPAQLMCRWLGYGTQNEASTADNLLHRREFSFTTGDDIYIRYLSYEDADGLRKACRCHLTPHQPYHVPRRSVRAAVLAGPGQEAAVQDRHWRRLLGQPPRPQEVQAL